MGTICDRRQYTGTQPEMIEDYIQYLGNLRWSSLGFGPLYEENHKEPESMHWVSQYSNANMVKTDFLKQRVRLMPKAQLWKMTYNPFTNNFAPHLKPLRYGAINDLTETFPLKTINKQLSPPLSHYPPHPLYKMYPRNPICYQLPALIDTPLYA